jgi:predicted N-formylglutamate amidohydrolase
VVGNDTDERIDLFYLPYYRIVREALNFIEPKYALCMHSFTKQYEDRKIREYEVGILFKEKNIIVDMLESVYKKNGVNYRLNEPYNPSEGVCHAMDSIITYDSPNKEVITCLLEFRNDYCSDKEYRKKHVNLLSPIVEELGKI